MFFSSKAITWHIDNAYFVGWLYFVAREIRFGGKAFSWVWQHFKVIPWVLALGLKCCFFVSSFRRFYIIFIISRCCCWCCCSLWFCHSFVSFCSIINFSFFLLKDYKCIFWSWKHYDSPLDVAKPEIFLRWIWDERLKFHFVE